MEMRSFKLEKTDAGRVLLWTEARRAIPQQNATCNKIRLSLQRIVILFMGAGPAARLPAYTSEA